LKNILHSTTEERKEGYHKNVKRKEASIDVAASKD